MDKKYNITVNLEVNFDTLDFLGVEKILWTILWEDDETHLENLEIFGKTNAIFKTNLFHNSIEATLSRWVESLIYEHTQYSTGCFELHIQTKTIKKIAEAFVPDRSITIEPLAFPEEKKIE